MVLRQGRVHKDNHVTDRQVGFWRHREWSLCSGFALAAHVVWALGHESTDSLNFLHEDKSIRNEWWDKYLICYRDYNEQATVMDAVYDGSGVVGCKKTHQRTYAVQGGGAEGLAPWQMNTITKHMVEKYYKSYQSEMDRTTVKVMAGHAITADYFVWSFDCL